MSSRFILYLSLIILSAVNTSFRWPVDNGRITSTFGESRWDHFHDGIDMTSQDNKIYPVESGQLLFFWDKTLFPLDNYPGGGNYKIIKHQKSIYSIYMHLVDGVKDKNIYTEKDSIGLAGNSGHSISRHLHFSMLNSKSRTSVNPAKLLPRFEDQEVPQISEIGLRIADKVVIIRDGSNIRLTRHYPLLIKINDAISGRERLGIYMLKVSHNNKKVLDVEFSELAFSKYGLVVHGKGFDKLFDEKGYYKVENVKYTSGQNIFQVFSTDYSGNQAEKMFTFDVKLDLEK